MYDFDDYSTMLVSSIVKKTKISNMNIKHAYQDRKHIRAIE